MSAVPGTEALAGLAGLALPDALARILAALGAETGTLHALRSDGALHLACHAGSIPEQLLPVIERIPVGKGMAGLAAQRGEPVQVCDLQTDTGGDARPGAKQTGMRGSVCVPVQRAGRLVGVLGVAVAAEREYSQAETAWLAEAGAVIASDL